MPDTTRQRLVDLLTRARTILYYSRHADAGQLVQDIDAQLSRPRGRSLSPKQQQITELLAQGKTTTQIVAELGVGEATVNRARNRHKERIPSK